MYTSPYGANNFGGNFNPLATLEEQLRKQLAEIENMSKSSPVTQPSNNQAFVNAVRGEVDRYMQERQQAVAAIPQPMQAIITAMESSLPTDDVKFLAENINAIPDFLRSKDGKDLLAMFADGLRKAGGPDAAVTAAPGKATG